MFCIVAFIVLSILGIFSAANRRLAKEAMDCVFRRITFRPCNTGFDEKMKAKILGKVIMRSEKLAGFINKRFEVLAWIFFVIFLGASVMGVRGLVLFYTTGSCNGVNSEAFCVFDPTGANNEISSVDEACSAVPKTIASLTLDGVDVASFPTLNAGSSETPIIFIGCYSCDYTRKTYPIVRRLAERYQAPMAYLEYPVKLHSDYLNKVGYCVNQQSVEKYWQLNDQLFADDKSKLEDEQFISDTLASLDLDTPALEACVNDPATAALVENQMEQIRGTNFYGTPTIFIGDEVFVGPKPYRVYAIALKGFFYWLVK
jgi:2-hydroxychromene-2-carboxylate isomerase